MAAVRVAAVRVVPLVVAEEATLVAAWVMEDMEAKGDTLLLRAKAPIKAA